MDAYHSLEAGEEGEKKRFILSADEEKRRSRANMIRVYERESNTLLNPESDNFEEINFFRRAPLDFMMKGLNVFFFFHMSFTFLF